MRATVVCGGGALLFALPTAAQTLPAATASPATATATSTPTSTATSTATANPTANPTPTPTPTVDPAWQARYAEARSALAEGRLEEAAAAFAVIAASAPDPEMRDSAADFAGLASGWVSRGFVLVPSRRLVLQSREPLGKDERTLDELALLYINTMVWGAGFGATTGVATQGQAAAYFIPGLAMAGAGATTVALLDNVGEHHLRYGVPNAISSGLYIGFEEGFFAGVTYAAAANNAQPGVVAGVMWGGSTVGAVAGGVVAHEVGTTPGRMSFVGSGSLWGGFLASFVTGAAAFRNNSASNSGTTATFVGGLIGTNVGLVFTAALADSVSPSIARVRFIDLGGLAGGLVAGGIYASAASSGGVDVPTFFGITAAGTAAGLVTGLVLTNGMAKDEPRRSREQVAWQPFMMPAQGGAIAGFSGSFE